MPTMDNATSANRNTNTGEEATTTSTATASIQKSTLTLRRSSSKQHKTTALVGILVVFCLCFKFHQGSKVASLVSSNNPQSTTHRSSTTTTEDDANVGNSATSKSTSTIKAAAAAAAAAALPPPPPTTTTRIDNEEMDRLMDVGNCTDIRYPDLTDILSRPSQIQANADFLNTITNTSEPLTDILLVNRYRLLQNETDGTLIKPPLQKAFRLFDWVILGEPSKKVKKFIITPIPNATHPVRSVYCYTHFLKKCLKLSNELLPPLSVPSSSSSIVVSNVTAGVDDSTNNNKTNKRILVIGNDDVPHLTANRDFVQQLVASKRFSKILVEPKDIELRISMDDGGDGVAVGSLPIGLNNFYIDELSGGSERLLKMIQNASLLKDPNKTQKKTKSVLAAWGAKWGYLDDVLQSRREAVHFTNTSCLAPRQMIDPKDYMQVLSQHRFLLAPTGRGIFTPKVMEALLVLTIPIVQRKPDSGAWDDLRDVYQWPIVIVDEWDEITPRNLIKWWMELAPKLHEGRLRLLTDSWFKTVMSQA